MVADFRLEPGSRFWVDQVAELNRIADKEDGRIITDHVPVTLFGIELDREAPGFIGRSFLATDGRETSEGWHSLPIFK